MKKNSFLLMFSIAAANFFIAPAQAASPVQGEWQTTARISSPMGTRTMSEHFCNQGQGVASIVMRQHGSKCSPWQRVSHDASDRVDVLKSVCTQSGPFPGGAMKMHVLAHVIVANNGRSAHGTVEASGQIHGYPFSSPPTLFTSRYIGACPGRS